MKNLIIRIVIFCPFILTSGLLFTQEMPSIPEQIKMFYKYEGKWEGTASMKMGTDVSTGSVMHNWSKISDGWGMLIDEELDIPAMGKKYLGHNILGYDIGEGQYHLYTIDNFADVHDHKGKMKDNAMNLEHKGFQPDGKPYKEKISLQMINDSEYKITGEAYSEGSLSYTFEATLNKVK